MKNGFLRMCSIVLVLVLLVNMLPMSIFAEEYRESLTATADASTEAVDASDAQIVEEIIENRTEFSKEFLLSNGLHMAAVYPDAVHYETADGWSEIDNTLTAKADGTYSNTSGVWDVSFPQQLTGAKSVVIEKDGYTFSFAMAGELRSSGDVAAVSSVAAASIAAEETFSISQQQLSTAAVAPIDTAALRGSYEYAEMAPVKLRSRLSYADVYQGTDIIYDLDSSTVKESIVMDAYSSTLRGYRYTLNVGDMIPVLEESGQITLYAPDRKTVVMVMPAPYLVDDADAYSSDIQVQLTGSGSSYTLTYILPQQWLAAEDRAWPVILDPIITANLSATNIQDQTVTQNTTYSYTWGHMKVGYDATDGLCYYYIKYVSLPTLTSSDVVVGASLQMYQAEGAANYVVEAHKVNGTWSSQGITWANKPAHDPIIEDYVVTNSANENVWDITDAVREWYAESNTGLMLKASTQAENSGVTNCVEFYSSDYQTSLNPVLAICFRNNNGLESYWDYTASSAGRAGTGYINNFTGNLVWVRDDIGFGGNRMPVSIQHIYNANDAGNNDFGLGYGWRTNYNQRVYRLEGQDCYVWEDSDGTAHYFFPGDKYYEDEDGLELTLADVGNGRYKYGIEDKQKNVMHFDENGRLSLIYNYKLTYSIVSVTYRNDDDDTISTITDGAGRVYGFAYGTDGLLSRISYVGKGKTVLSYVKFSYTGSQLTGVTDKDGKQSTYTYADGLLSSVSDVDGYKLDYTYYPVSDALWQPYRVKTVSEKDGTTSGGSLTIEYAHNQTTFMDQNGNIEIMQFNDFGNTISTQDDEGRAQYAQYAINSLNDEKNADATAKGNQLRISSNLQNTVGNILADPSFENGEVWNVTDSSGNGGQGDGSVVPSGR